MTRKKKVIKKKFLNLIPKKVKEKFFNLIPKFMKKNICDLDYEKRG